MSNRTGVLLERVVPSQVSIFSEQKGPSIADSGRGECYAAHRRLLGFRVEGGPAVCKEQ